MIKSKRFWLLVLSVALVVSVAGEWALLYQGRQIGATMDEQHRLILIQQNIIDHMQEALTPVTETPVY